MVKLVEEYIGAHLDYVLLNNGELPQKALKRYLDRGEHTFEDDLGRNGRVIIREDLVANSVIKKDEGDKLVRSLVRHDPRKLGEELYKIFRGDWFSRVWRSIINVYR
jgi:hypothetical protein